MLGSSGVGKSTLINVLAGEHIMNTGEISEGIDRGKHVTSHRELIVFEDGILIDNPGMREIGITESRDGIEMTFDEISALSKTCKYKDCKHISENGCAVLIALENDELSLETYENYLKMEKERMHFESSSLQRKKKGHVSVIFHLVFIIFRKKTVYFRFNIYSHNLYLRSTSQTI